MEKVGAVLRETILTSLPSASNPLFVAMKLRILDQCCRLLLLLPLLFVFVGVFFCMFVLMFLLFVRVDVFLFV